MNYCKCAWLGASRQPPSAAAQQLPHQLCYEDPLACLVRAEKKESKRGTCILICEGQVRQHINRWALSGSRRAQMAWLTGISLLLNGPRWIAARELPFGITMENTDHYVFSYRYGRRGLKLGAEKEAMWSTSKKMRDFEATMVIIVILIIHPLDTHQPPAKLCLGRRKYGD
ncbi:hypothetical protein BO79DRAFT_279059 [Aspergillus costaricaensis CBS 115574]|uniref:Uncharacterized protein n=1 Tax=Aspergillus costaricaensis CBS 115574 TaxID=1448317 RepID=A0ACD1HYQ4_9EURO|nr:hypothetical protein BO79DRAFT_279059 [Aspergillus costaricaensis CBS 115574]RAK83169.1 hypothetical protein BO79DRAFT_279059 [Aspergillus costaricaensis CBS 115574]